MLKQALRCTVFVFAMAEKKQEPGDNGYAPRINYLGGMPNTSIASSDTELESGKPTAEIHEPFSRISSCSSPDPDMPVLETPSRSHDEGDQHPCVLATAPSLMETSIHTCETVLGDSGRNGSQFQTGETIQDWWPKYPDGQYIRHLYHLLDAEHGSDIYFPDIELAMSHYLRENQPVDFTDYEVQKWALLHVSKESERAL